MPQRKIIGDSKPQIVTLTGFYITPFGKKIVSITGKGAEGKIQTEVDFDHIARIVIETINAIQHKTENNEYHFKLHRHEARAKYLEDSIVANIDDANFIVVDWTTHNQNVLLEAGYAQGRAKHGIHSAPTTQCQATELA